MSMKSDHWLILFTDVESITLSLV